MNQHRVLTVLLCGCLVLGLAGCGLRRPGDGLRTVSVDGAEGGAEAAALAVTGVPVQGPAGHRTPRLRRHVLHGEVVVQTKAGPRTVVVQRGSVTAKDGAGLTVRSADGFTLTWATDGQTRVVAGGARAGLDQVAVGAEVGVGGIKGDPQAARLVVVPTPQ
ncbi:hypothetical protein [Dactylosporangium sp. CA-092794]|uniref:hypothetical protein n=1 Tax=Dactylosporangium sp. CA-092794 TaxID=3239929 RepID=UPI003D947E62